MNNIIEYITRKGRLALTAALALGCSMAVYADKTGNVLKGKVVDPDGKPIPGAVQACLHR